METIIYNGIGRRKTSVARVFLKEGEGIIQVNNKKIEDYFYMNEDLIQIILQPLKLFNLENKYNLKVRVKGSGFKAQSESIRLAISRILLKISLEHRSSLKSLNLLTRDSRSKERRKIGLLKARKRPPYVKR